MPEHTKLAASIVGAVAPPDDSISLVRVAALFVRSRRMIVAIVVTCVLVTAAVTILRHRTYTATASFECTPMQSGQLTAGLAAQLGLSLGLNGNSQSPQFYADLVQSRAVLGVVVDSAFVIPTDSGPHRMTLVAAYRHADDSPARARDRALEQLRKHVTSDVASTTGVVTITVTERSPSLAAGIARVVMQRVNDFNLRERQAQGGAEREFTEQRLAASLAELHAAENALTAFYAENRDFTQSPRLNLEAERLRRVVSNKQDVYTSLAQGYEQARLTELRDTPVIMPIDEPVPPSRPDPRGLVRNVILAFFVSSVGACAIVVLMEYFRTLREVDGHAFDELVSAWHRKA